MLLLILAGTAACVSVDPVRPPGPLRPPGSKPWVRSLARGHSRALQLRGALLHDVRDNATAPSQLEFGFPYEWTGRIDDLNVVIVTCNQADRAVALTCSSEPPGAFSMRVEADCATGTIMLPDGSFTLEPWFERSFFVGYLFRESGEAVAAVDTDHDQDFPVWFSDSKRARATIPAALTLMSLSLEFPQHCGRLQERRRYPRAN